MHQESSSARRSTELIASNTVIGGSIETSRHLRISGTVEGRVESAGTVVLEPTARVGGGIRAEATDISGHVEGDINAQDGTVTLRSSAVVRGNISAAQLIVEEGARLQGRCTTTRSLGGDSQTSDDPFQPSGIKAA